MKSKFLFALLVVVGYSAVGIAEHVEDISVDLDEFLGDNFNQQKQENLKEGYFQLNELLRKLVPDHTAEDDLNALKKIAQTWKPIQIIHLDRPLRMALDTILTLTNNGYDHDGYQCSLSYVATLAEAYKLTFNRLHVMRIHDIVQDVLQAHPRECFPFYKQEYRSMLKKMDQKKATRVQEALATLTSENFWFDSPGKGGLICQTGYVFNDIVLKKISNQIMGVIERDNLAKAEKSRLFGGGKQIEPTISTKTLDKYLFGPCEYYNNRLRSVFRPARFDLITGDAIRKHYIGKDAEFADGFANYRLCLYLVRQRSQLYERFIKSVSE